MNKKQQQETETHEAIFDAQNGHSDFIFSAI